MASRRDIEEHYSIDDLADDNDAMDAMADAERRAHKHAEEKAKRERQGG